jgi:hypothetical protein
VLRYSTAISLFFSELRRPRLIVIIFPSSDVLDIHPLITSETLLDRGRKLSYRRDLTSIWFS